MSLTHATDRLEVIHDDTEVAPSVVEDQQPDPAEPASGTQQPGGSAVEQTGTRPTFTITDAATACSVSRKTITRKLPELAGHGAAKDDDGVWRIPVEALLAVGLHPGRSLQGAAPAPKRPVPSPTPARVVERDTVTVSRDRWDDLRIRLARAEAEASERALALADARLALRALTAGPGHGGSPGSAPSGSASPRAQSAAPDEAPVPPVQAGPMPARVTPMPAGLGPTSAVPASPVPASAAASSSAPEADPDEVVAARNLAARTGGYVPAAPAPAKKRRWWHSA